ncbi:MAG TPA: glycosyltransferase, partial [Burkholderiaceae bacterium]
MRSLFLLNSLCFGGAEKQVVALVNGLCQQNGHRVWIQCLKDDDALLPQVDPALRPQVLPNLHVRSGLEPFAVAALARRIDAHAIDVVVCTNMYALLYGSLARALCRRRNALRLVEVFHTTEVASRKERLSMTLYRRLLRATDLLVYVCRGQAAHWQAQGLRAREEVVIHNGIDTARFTDRSTPAENEALRRSFGFSPEDFVVGICAVMRPEKAHDDLVRAVAALHARGVPVRALLVGDGPLRGAVEARIAELGLTASIRITGLVADVRPYVAACDAMALTSRTETFSLAALEAMAMGKPMVMARIGGAAEQVDDGVDGLLYPPGDVAALTDALGAMADRARCAAM